MKKKIQRFNLKTGIGVSLVFPAIFTFAQPAPTVSDVLLRFLNFFLFIAAIWILNYACIDFQLAVPKKERRGRVGLYTRMAATSVLSVPVYLLLAAVFRQEQATLASLFNSNFSGKSWFFFLLRIMLFNAGIIITKYLYDSGAEQRRILLENEHLKREHLNAVHESLKQQVDPHFLFNSLNTLQSLVKQNSPQSVAFIGELSSVYRYMLLRRDKKYVTVGEELDFLRSYLYLLKIRFGEAFQMQVNVNDEHLRTLIPPHTLQLLAENTVKHNKFSMKYPLYIRIFSTEKFLVVQNNFSEKARGPAETSGVGLKNISRRYALLFNKEIAIHKSAEFFQVSLPLIEENESTDH
ncbi:sensor histidine kinase [Pedobacter yulinensis]|uniref:sensor histidine kinase n=1 Tax=Pedobacter yulinensis TaxID=2126353 RepID=UPI0013A683A6|nr:histidine kinase [Pedobacter yulinensis]